MMRGTAVFCALLLVRAVLASAQTPSAKPEPAQQSAPGNLKIVIVQGSHSKHSVINKAAIQTVVEVRDADNAPQPGVRVYFQLPESGPSGFFPGQKLSQVAITNAQGQAGTTGFVPNDIQGPFSLKVTAMKDQDTATILVPQANSDVSEEARPVERTSRKGLWILLAIGAGAGAAAAAVLAGGGGSTGAGAVPGGVVLVPGPVTVGPPR